MGILRRQQVDQNDAAVGSEQGKSVDLKHLTASEFDQVIQDPNRLTVVDFWAEWCVPCHMIAPFVQQFSE